MSTVSAARGLLATAWGSPVEVAAVQRIEPWSVARLTVRGGPVSSVIMKWVRDGTADDPAARAHPDQAVTEAITLEFLADHGVRAPRLIASGHGIVIMEDFPDHVALDRLICQHGFTDAVRAGLIEAAGLLADRHARTVGRETDHLTRFAGRLLVDPVRERRRFMAEGWRQLRRHATELGWPPDDDAVAEAAACYARLDQPGPLSALSNGDSATNNVLVGTPGSAVIIDYEFAGYRHCLTDLTDFYLPGPRWVTVPDAVEYGFEHAYRSALGGVIPEIADDDRFGGDLAAAGLQHAFGRLGNLPRIDARPAGDRSRLERRNSIESAADLAESRGAYPALAAWCRGLGRVLRRRWPDTDVRTDRLPVFLPRD
ncbi:hypothetical protein [Microlunatus sp. GCM10028923]|uniref:hypothetical protein n=1 Tax=Microlunatus sp. GCM10028923 TaxID=3273400 RepID=UPI00361B7C45